MITADTITDEQIHKLRQDALYAKPFCDSYIVDDCDRALGLAPMRYRSDASKPDATSIHSARARCAEILNARNGAKP